MSFAVGDMFNNPGGGTSIIISLNQNNICYRRKNSKITVSLLELYNAYQAFKGMRCSSTDLKAYNPGVFDSKFGGHSCNCTFLFMILERMKLSSAIQGRGVSGDPFYVDIY
jgi:hypothetical protein